MVGDASSHRQFLSVNGIGQDKGADAKHNIQGSIAATSQQNCRLSLESTFATIAKPNLLSS